MKARYFDSTLKDEDSIMVSSSGPAGWEALLSHPQNPNTFMNTPTNTTAPINWAEVESYYKSCHSYKLTAEAFWHQGADRAHPLPQRPLG